MEIEKRQKGRPRKEKDTIQPWQFGRAALVMCAYHEVRKRGEKHSIAVKYAVDFVKQRNPEMAISETEVRRILAKWRPRSSETIFHFERKILTDDDIRRHSWIREQLAALQATKGLKLEVPPNFDICNGAVFTIRFTQRPDYPRHNRKTPKE